MEKMTFTEFREAMRKFNEERGYKTKGTKEKLVGVVVIDQKSFKDEYSLEERSYRTSSDNKAFLPDQISNSIFANCLDGKDDGVRLDWYIPTDWTVEYCYLEGEYGSQTN